MIHDATDPLNAGPYHEPAQAFERRPKPVRFVAYYLPQFHPCDENDRVWGKGFTEWTNVTKARPRFAGHIQPNLPADLGFYDLRLPQVLRQQCAMATASGIDAFCFHHYWFSGHSVLDTPLKLLLADKTIDMPFFINWANENWSQRWDGGNNDVILGQDYRADDPQRLVGALHAALSDHRYMKIDGRPLLMIYRVSLIPHAAAFIDGIRAACMRGGLGNPFIMTSDGDDHADVRGLGLDAIAAFPPHRNWFVAELERDALQCQADFHGRVKSYDAMVENALQLRARARGAPYFRGVAPRWDNTPRRARDGIAFAGSTPQKYERWLRDTAQLTLYEHPANARLLFINAWNEWAEGAYLEPDRHFGWAYLNATARVAASLSDRAAATSFD